MSEIDRAQLVRSGPRGCDGTALADCSARSQVIAELRANLVKAAADIVRAIEHLPDAPSTQDDGACAVVDDHLDAASQAISLAAETNGQLRRSAAA